MGATIRPYDTIKAKLLPLAAGQSVSSGDMACADTSAATVKKGAAGNANLVRIGSFDDTVDNSASTASVLVQVTLEKEIVATWFDNATGSNKVTTANLFQDVYILNSTTVTLASGGNSKAGRVWGVDALKGVLVESYTL